MIWDCWPANQDAGVGIKTVVSLQWKRKNGKEVLVPKGTKGAIMHLSGKDDIFYCYLTEGVGLVPIHLNDIEYL